MRRNKCLPTTVLMLVLGALLEGLPGSERVPWNAERHPSDRPRSHVQEIASQQQRYRVVQAGTMDGRNCRSPQGVWTPFEQTWESNRSVRLENVGQTLVVNPWLSNGRNDFRTLATIVARAVEPGMTDAEKAMALWWQEVQHRFHYEGDNQELLSPVKVLNIYGHNTCGNDSICLAGLWKTAGLKVAPARLVGHCVTQVYYDDAWHLFDGDMHSVYLLRDNQTIAGEQDLVRDHDLIKRTHTQGILRPQGRAGDEWESSIYVFEGPVGGDRDADRESSMNMTLRPGEALEWRWGHVEPVKYFGTSQHRFAERVCNGIWEYAPDFSQDAWRSGVASVSAIRSGATGLTSEDGKTGEIVWGIRSPYVLVGGRLEVEGHGAEFALSWDGKGWEQARSNLDAFFPPVGKARYAYWLRCRLSGNAALRSLRIINDLQMAPLSLPEMSIGENEFTYSDESAGERRVRITHHWVERTASAAPRAPESPIHPPDGGESPGTDVTFAWQPAVDPDGDRIADYHFELSARADMKWPLSMSFTKLISRTVLGDQASKSPQEPMPPRFVLQAPGELNPGTRYYWRVRAKDQQGVWGSWSKTWSFTPRGPAPPLHVALEFDPRQRVGVLRWKPNPRGSRPASYRIYASDEKGFSVSDELYSVAAGLWDFLSKTSTPAPTTFSQNFLVEIPASELTVIGSNVEFPAAAYYRVVAVDESGARSGPSDYVAAPRPLIASQPITRAQIGQAYTYDVRTVRSLGDLRTRVVGGRETMGYWDVEQPTFALVQGPSWLSIDPSTGRLSGKPEAHGRAKVVVSVRLQREHRDLDEGQLRWGVEKVVRSRIEEVGSATQEFEIEVNSLPAPAS